MENYCLLGMVIYGYMLSVNSDYWLEMAICGELLLIKNYCLFVSVITGFLFFLENRYFLIFLGN